MEGYALQPAIQFFDSWLAYRARQVDIPGFSVAIWARDSIVFSQAYGVADLASGEPLTTAYLFGVASQSKMFTATAIMQLVEVGKLRLDDFAQAYVPWLAKHRDSRFGEITIRQLLSHSAGLIRDGLDINFWALSCPFPSAAQLRTMVLGSNIALEPNTQLKYSNLGYALLGQVIETVSGQRYPDYIDAHILQPLGLTNTFADYKPVLAGRTATAYGVRFEHHRTSMEPRLPTKALAAAVGTHTTPEDMCRFAAVHFFDNDLLLNNWTKKEMQRKQWDVDRGYDNGAAFGLGFEIQTIGNRRVVGHSGHLAGYCTATFFDPYARLAVSVAANCKDAPSVSMVRGIFEALDWFSLHATSRTPRTVARFNARVRNATSTVEIIATKGQLAAIDPDDWEPFTWLEELEHVNPSTLRVSTAGSIFNEGEFLHYTFADDVVQAVRYAGFTMLAEPDWQRTVKQTLDDTEHMLTFDDLRHNELRVGHIVKVEKNRRPQPYRLTVDFGPQLRHTYVYAHRLPPLVGRGSLNGTPVLGVVFPVWRGGKRTNEIVVLGMTVDHSIGNALLPGNLFALSPDPATPRTLWRAAALKRYQRYIRESQRVFKLQALPEYPIENIGGLDMASLTAWLQGKRRKAQALMDKQRESSPYWLPRNGEVLRIVLTDDPPTAYSQWYIAFAKRVAIPLNETIYLLPRKNLTGIDLPPGDFAIFDKNRVAVNGYTHEQWTHSTIYEYDAGKTNDLQNLLQLQGQLIRLARTRGQKLEA